MLVWASLLLGALLKASPSVAPLCPDILATFVHKFDVNSRITLAYQVNYMSLRVICTGHNHGGIWRDLHVEFVEDSFTFINFAQPLLQVVGDIKAACGRSSISDVPNMHGKVISRENVRVLSQRGEFGS